MQNKHDSILRATNKDSAAGCNILTFATHEAYQTNMADLPYNFYVLEGPGLKEWDTRFRTLPLNHHIISEENISAGDVTIDIIFSQSKFGQYQKAKPIADMLNVPLISLEHTLPNTEWADDNFQKVAFQNMLGDLNVFVNMYNAKAWGFENNPTLRIAHNCIDTELFNPTISDTFIEDPGHNYPRNKVLTVVNDYIKRDYHCGFTLYQRLTEGLPTYPVGDTKGLSVTAACIDELVYFYQTAGVFLNTSLVSTMPTTLLEAMACGCPVVTTATYMIPEIVQDGVNGFCSNDENYLKEKLRWCLDNPKEARETVGVKGRQTIIDKFAKDKFEASWRNIFEEAFGMPHIVRLTKNNGKPYQTKV